MLYNCNVAMLETSHTASRAGPSDPTPPTETATHPSPKSELERPLDRGSPTHAAPLAPVVEQRGHCGLVERGVRQPRPCREELAVPAADHVIAAPRHRVLGEGRGARRPASFMLFVYVVKRTKKRSNLFEYKSGIRIRAWGLSRGSTYI